MTENEILWRYENEYYEDESDAIIALIRDYPNATISQYLNIAEEKILKVYDVKNQ